MWTFKDYDNLQTFGNYVEATGIDNLFTDTLLSSDDVTKQALVEWYYYRKIVDNDRFARYFRRYLTAAENQYYNLIRIQTTDIDPLVGNYLERQILRKGAQTERATDTTKATTSRTTTTDATGKTSTTGESTTTGTSTGNAKMTNQTTGKTNETANENDNTRSKHGETPQAYVGGGSDGMALDWSYLSSQDQTQTNIDRESETNNTTTETGETTSSGTNTGKVNTTTEGENTDKRTTVETTGTDNSGDTSKTASTSDDTRERLTGRQESPQDMLKRAVEYVKATNAFLWLVDILDVCFMDVYDL